MDGLEAIIAAATPGPWAVGNQPGQTTTWGDKAHIGISAQARWDAAYDADQDDLAAADDASWICGIWGDISDEDHANAALIAMAPDLAAEVLRLRARISELEAEQRWQPIETAPPYTEVLVRHLWDDGQARFFIADVWGDGSIHTDDALYRPNFTHWKPAPSTELLNAAL